MLVGEKKKSNEKGAEFTREGLGILFEPPKGPGKKKTSLGDGVQSIRLDLGKNGGSVVMA